MPGHNTPNQETRRFTTSELIARITYASTRCTDDPCDQCSAQKEELMWRIRNEVMNGYIRASAHNTLGLVRPTTREDHALAVERMTNEFIAAALESEPDSTTMGRYSFTYAETNEHITIPGAVWPLGRGTDGTENAYEYSQVRNTLAEAIRSSQWPTRLRSRGRIIARGTGEVADDSVVDPPEEQPGTGERDARALREVVCGGDEDPSFYVCRCRHCASSRADQAATREDSVPTRTRPDDRRTTKARRLP